ncbi:hypothetical protein Acr_18g0007050 [Actinidia rufa]|uniref:Uncharacterized protein n=1 Tax=Actinidia rufa TaxID=165716 RepID=A0A7J0G6X1_9ERIC|nr:hypothetical protein Acr_18g0007050 [Actinidia rufa]
MELNRAQLLAHDDEALEYSYLADLPGWAPIPNQPDVEEGDGVLPSYLYADVCQLRSNCAHSGQVDTSNEASFYCRHTRTCSSTSSSKFQEIGSSKLGTMVSGRSRGSTAVCPTASRKVADVLEYESIYQHVIPQKAEEPNRIRLPPLHIEERAPERDAYSSESEEEKGEETASQLVLNKRQNPVIRVVKLGVPASPISISSSDNEHSDDLAYTPLQSVQEVEIVHSFREADNLNTSLTRVDDLRVFPPGLSAAEVSSREWQVLLLLSRVGLPFKATNSSVDDKQSDVALPVSDIADFSLVRNCYHEASTP